VLWWRRSGTSGAARLSWRWPKAARPRVLVASNHAARWWWRSGDVGLGEHVPEMEHVEAKVVIVVQGGESLRGGGTMVAMEIGCRWPWRVRLRVAERQGRELGGVGSV
jgi:hypothetical protein